MGLDLLLLICLALLGISTQSLTLADVSVGSLNTNASSSLRVSSSPAPLSTVSITPRAPDQPYNQDAYIRWHQFEKTGATSIYKNAVLNALFVVMDMITVTLGVLEEELKKPIPDDPTFLRYFQQDKTVLGYVYAVFQALNQGIGNPLYEEQRQSSDCGIPLPPVIQIWYDNPPKDYYFDETQPECEDHKTYAFVFVSDQNKPNILDRLVICPLFFETYQGKNHIEDNVDLIGPWITFGLLKEENEPSFTSAQTLLHELMHYRKLYWNSWAPPSWMDSQIDDIKIQDVSTTPPGIQYTAWGAWAATKLKDTNFAVTSGTHNDDFLRNGMHNADNWVYTAVEHYIKARFKPTIVWQDPPDWRTGPHFPPGHPMAGMEAGQPRPDCIPGPDSHC